VSTGLIALLDDVVGLAKVAAASLDDVAAQATKAGAKAAGIVIDDAAVTPRYVVGFAANRELAIIGRIAAGSLKNKLLYLLPAAIALSLVAPWAITPLLMLGGAYLCYEGAEKVYEALWPHQAHGHEVAIGATRQDAQGFEDEKVRGAIKTDFILSAEIMAITLSTVPAASFWTQAAVLAVVGIGITVVVYGGVALIVKADDAGVALAGEERPLSGLFGLLRRAPASQVPIGQVPIGQAPIGQVPIGQPPNSQPPSGADRLLRPLTQGLGRGLVLGMPVFLRVLGVVGTAAMVWVGGGIIIHGLEEYGLTAPGHAIHVAAAAVGHALPAIAGAAEWVVAAAASGVFGLLVGGGLIPVVEHVAAPALRRLS
jgi:predicted DNA repair protein MutK